MIGIGNSGQRVENHFVDSDQMVEIGKGGQQVADHIVGTNQMIDVGKDGQQVEEHFVEATDMVEIGSGAQRSRKTVTMSHYARALGIQSADTAPPAQLSSPNQPPTPATPRWVRSRRWPGRATRG